jgi:hypothetical protein
MRQVERTPTAAFVFPVGPGAVERMLQDRELVRVVADVVEEPRDQNRRDRSFAHPDWPQDGGADFVAGQARDEVLAVIDRLGQAEKLRAVPDEVRAHRKQDVDRHFALRARFEQQLDEGDGVLPRAIGRLGRTSRRSAEAEQFFELVHYYEQLHAFRQARLRDDVDEAETAQPQRGFHEFLCGKSLVVPPFEQHAGFCQRFRQRADRIAAAARTELRHAPRRAGTGHVAAMQRRPQAAIDQRGLAASRGADHRQEAMRGKLVDHAVDLALAPEEQVLLIRTKRTQARERVSHGADRRCASHGRSPKTTLTILSSTIFWETPPRPSIRFAAASSAMMSSLSSELGAAIQLNTARSLRPLFRPLAFWTSRSMLCFHASVPLP